MIAQPGVRYAQIIAGRVHWVFTRNELPEWQDSAFEVQDITGRPEVVEGSIHRGGPVFDPPPPPPASNPIPGLRRADLLTACLDVESDATVPATVKTLAQKLRMLLPTI
jgi:hypothetical protein